MTPARRQITRVAAVASVLAVGVALAERVLDVPTIAAVLLGAGLLSVVVAAAGSREDARRGAVGALLRRSLLVVALTTAAAAAAPVAVNAMLAVPSADAASPFSRMLVAAVMLAGATGALIAAVRYRERRATRDS